MHDAGCQHFDHFWLAANNPQAGGGTDPHTVFGVPLRAGASTSANSGIGYGLGFSPNTGSGIQASTSNSSAPLHGDPAGNTNLDRPPYAQTHLYTGAEPSCEVLADPELDGWEYEWKRPSSFGFSGDSGGRGSNQNHQGGGDDDGRQRSHSNSNSNIQSQNQSLSRSTSSRPGSRRQSPRGDRDRYVDRERERDDDVHSQGRKSRDEYEGQIQPSTTITKSASLKSKPSIGSGYPYHQHHQHQHPHTHGHGHGRSHSPPPSHGHATHSHSSPHHHQHQHTNSSASQSRKKESRKADYDTLLGFSTSMLSHLLCHRSMPCHEQFELIVDDLAFIGHPVCSMGESGDWGYGDVNGVDKTKVNGGLRGRNAGSPNAGAENHESGITVIPPPPPTVNANPGDGEPGPAPIPDPNANPHLPDIDTHDSIQSFHLVLVLDLPDPSSFASGNLYKYFKVIYEQIALTVTAVLYQEQIEHGYVEKECKVLGDLREGCISRGEQYTSFISKALAQSSLARALRTLYEGIKANRIAHVSINELTIELQLPPYLDSLIHSFSYTNGCGEDGDWDELGGLGGGEFLMNRSFSFTDLGVGAGEGGDGDDEERDMLLSWGPKLSFGWRLPVLAPWKSLLLVDGEGEEVYPSAPSLGLAPEVEGVEGIGTPGVDVDGAGVPLDPTLSAAVPPVKSGGGTVDFLNLLRKGGDGAGMGMGLDVDSLSPEDQELAEGLIHFLKTASIFDSLAVMAHSLGWDLETQVYPTVRWLVEHRKAKIVDTVHKDLKTVFVLPARFPRPFPSLSAAFSQAFPTVSLHDICTSLRSSDTHFYASVVKSKELLPVYRDVVTWMLKRDLLVTLHLRVRIVATKDLKIRVRRERMAKAERRRARKDVRGREKAEGRDRGTSKKKKRRGEEGDDDNEEFGTLRSLRSWIQRERSKEGSRDDEKAGTSRRRKASTKSGSRTRTRTRGSNSRSIGRAKTLGGTGVRAVLDGARGKRRSASRPTRRYSSVHHEYDYPAYSHPHPRQHQQHPGLRELHPLSQSHRQNHEHNRLSPLNLLNQPFSPGRREFDLDRDRDRDRERHERNQFRPPQFQFPHPTRSNLPHDDGAINLDLTVQPDYSRGRRGRSGEYDLGDGSSGGAGSLKVGGEVGSLFRGGKSGDGMRGLGRIGGGLNGSSSSASRPGERSRLRHHTFSHSYSYSFSDSEDHDYQTGLGRGESGERSQDGERERHSDVASGSGLRHRNSEGDEAHFEDDDDEEEDNSDDESDDEETGYSSSTSHDSNEDEGEEEEYTHSSIVNEPAQASALERRWLTAMSDGKDPLISKRFDQINQYFDGKRTDDEILYRAEITRKDLREVLHCYDEYLLTVLHPA